jgi:hypothetical protein
MCMIINMIFGLNKVTNFFMPLCQESNTKSTWKEDNWTMEECSYNNWALLLAAMQGKTLMMPNRLGETSVHKIWKISRKLLQGGGFFASISNNLGTNQRRLVKAKASNSGYLSITYYVLFLFHLGLIWRQNLQHRFKFYQRTSRQ